MCVGLRQPSQVPSLRRHSLIQRLVARYNEDLDSSGVIPSAEEMIIGREWRINRLSQAAGFPHINRRCASPANFDRFLARDSGSDASGRPRLPVPKGCSAFGQPSLKRRRCDSVHVIQNFFVCMIPQVSSATAEQTGWLNSMNHG